MSKFRKRQVEVEAWQIGCSGIQQPQWLRKAIVDDVVFYSSSYLGYKGWFIKTLEGTMHASEGDWIVRGIKDELWAVKPDIFVLTYEPVED
jgi:hypothetical protein